MTIIRDGKKIELTAEELYDAWHEKQEQYYTSDIESDIDSRLEGMSDEDIQEEYGCTAEELRELIPEIVYKYWDYNDSNDLISECMYSNRAYAISHVVEDNYGT